MAYDARSRSDANVTTISGPSCAKQDFKNQCDLNVILKKYARNGINPFVITCNAKYGDFTSVPDHREALDLIISSEQHFANLPAVLRRRFNNQPVQLLDFLADESNRQEAIELGLVASESQVPPIVEPQLSNELINDK